MSFKSQKITNAEIAAHGVQSQPNKLTGTAQQNKLVFDALVTDVVQKKLNGLIDELQGAGAAAQLGIDTVTDMDASNVQDALEALVDMIRGVTQGAVADGSITTAKLASGAVTAEKLAPGIIGAAQLADGTVGTAKIADKSITTAKIALLAITTALLADKSVTTAKLGDLAVTAAKIANATIDATKLASSAVTAVKIADGAVTAAKLASSGATAGNYGPSSAATLAFGGSVNVPRVTVDAKGRVTSIAHYAIKLPAAPTYTGIGLTAEQVRVVKAGTATPTTSTISDGQIYLKYS